MQEEESVLLEVNAPAIDRCRNALSGANMKVLRLDATSSVQLKRAETIEKQDANKAYRKKGNL